MRIVATIILIILSTLFLYPQTNNYIKGKVVYQKENNLEEEQPGITVLIEETGDRNITDNDGVFKIYLNKNFKAGDKITFKIEKKGWAIRDPLLGKTRIPSDPEKDMITLNILPKRSPLFLTDQQIIRYIEYAVLKSSSSIDASIINYSKLPLESLLDTMAYSWGFKVSEIESAVGIWIDKTLKDTSKLYEKGLAEYANKNFDKAGYLFLKSANIKIKEYKLIDADYKAMVQKRKRIIKETARDLVLSAESYYGNFNYDSTIIVSKHALKFIQLSEDWESYASELNRIASCYYLISSKLNDKSIVTYVDSAYDYYHRGLLLAQKKNLNDWEWIFEGNLAGISLTQIECSEANDKFQKTLNIKKEYTNLLKRKNNSFSLRDSIISLNNIGGIYIYLYEYEPDSNIAAHYLDSAMWNFNKIICDSTFKKGYPKEWAIAIRNYSLFFNEFMKNRFGSLIFFEKIATLILNLDDKSNESNINDTNKNLLRNNLITNYTALKESELIYKKFNDILSQVFVINDIFLSRINFVIYFNEYLNNDFIAKTDSILNREYILSKNLKSELINLSLNENKSLLNIIKILNNDKHNQIVKNEVIKSNKILENVLTKDDLLKNFSVEVKEYLLLNNLILSRLSSKISQKNIYLLKSCIINEEIIKECKNLKYMRILETAFRISRLIDCNL